MSEAKYLKPKFNVGEYVYYTDRQNRVQTGKVQSIDGHWTSSGSAYLVYALQHPTYRNGRMYCGEDIIMGAANEL